MMVPIFKKMLKEKPFWAEEPIFFPKCGDLLGVYKWRQMIKDELKDVAKKAIENYYNKKIYAI